MRVAAQFNVCVLLAGLVGFAAAAVAGWGIPIGDALWALINMALWVVAVVR